MKNFLISFYVTLIFFSIFSTNFVTAQNIQSSNEVILSKNQTIDGDYFASGNNVTISGTVNGDVYTAGGNILIEGTINGDVLATGGNINITGNVTNNIRAAGGQIIISGLVGRNISVVGGNATIANSARVSGSLVTGVGMVTIQSPIEKSINVAAGNAVIASTINGNITAGVGALTLTPNAVVNGDINYWSNQQANIQPGASVSGQVKQNLPPSQPKDREDVSKNFTGFKIAFSLALALSYLLGGLLLVTLFPVYSLNIMQTITDKPLLSFGIGLLITILFPILFILLLLTFFGIPIALILLAIFCILAFFAPIVVFLTIGQKILQRNRRVTLGWSLFLGLVIYILLTFIPIIGGLISIIATMIGIGAILIQQKNIYQTLRSKKVV